MASDAAPSFPVPYTGASRQNWRKIATGLRNNALAGFPPEAFENFTVARNFVGHRQIIVSDPAAIRHVLIENAENYRRTASVARLLDPVIGRGLFLADGDDWRTQRRIAAPAFAPRVMPQVAAEVAAVADKFVATLGNEAGQAVELFPRLQLLALEVAATALFSLDLADEGPALRAEMQRYAEGIGRPSLLDFLLPRGWPTPLSFARWRFRRIWMKLIAAVLATRDATSGEDLFSLMARSGTGSERLTEQSATMLMAGHETTAVALFWAVNLIAAVPEAQDRIAAEAAPLDLSRESAAAALPSLVYTRAVVDEALRLYPPAFSLVRQARAADAAAGLEIPRHAVVLIVPWVLHRHRRLWRDPDLFDPARFLPDAEPPERFSYLPFGAGPRACIGAQFALTESVLVLARLAQMFRIERIDNQPVLPVAMITLQPDHSPLFRLTPR